MPGSRLRSMAMRGGERSEPSDGTDVDLDRVRESRRQLRKDLLRNVAGIGDTGDRLSGRHPRTARAVVLAAAVVRAQGAEQVGLVASGAAFWLVISAVPAAIAVVALVGRHELSDGGRGIPWAVRTTQPFGSPSASRGG